MSASGHTYVFEVDHLGYLTNRRHRRETLANLRRFLHRPHLSTFRVLHEADLSCCRREAWLLTAIRIQDALADDGDYADWGFCSSGMDVVIPSPEVGT